MCGALSQTLPLSSRIFFFFRSATGFTLREENVREVSARHSRRREMGLPEFRQTCCISVCLLKIPFLGYCISCFMEQKLN